MWLCKRDLSKECKGDYKDCTDCILDKIRAEIYQLSDSRCEGITVTIYSWNGMKRRVLDIIDKYKSESEVSE